MKEIEITTGMNGYPQNLHRGYIGFYNYEEARRFAEEHKGEVVSLRRRDGWMLWESQGWTNDLYSIDADTYGDDYSIENDRETYEANSRELISQMIADGAGLDDLAATLKDMCEVADNLDDLEEDEAVLLCCGKYSGIIQTRTMRYSVDVWNYEIGVEIHGYGE